MQPTSAELDGLLSFATSIAREAGGMIKDGQEKRLQQESTQQDLKTSSVDLVTEVDRAVERLIKERIQATYPDHLFIGEETSLGNEVLTDAPTWIGLKNISPIDGTANFVHGNPEVCTSIGLCMEGTPVVGVIYNPFLDHMYTAAIGRGAKFNGQPLPLYGRPRSLNSLGEALVMVDCSSKRDPTMLRTKFDNYFRLASRHQDGGAMVHSLRITGSAALSIALTARGAVDMYAEVGAKPWDVCAGMCILREAGGRVFGGRQSTLEGRVENDASLFVNQKYLFVRSIAPSDAESSDEAQWRIAREYYGIVRDLRAP